MEISFSIFIWLWFFIFVEFVLVFGFVFFWYFFYFVKFQCSGILTLRLWKSLLFVTHSNWCFIGVLQAIYDHSNIILFQLFDFYCNPSGCLEIWDLSVGNFSFLVDFIYKLFKWTLKTFPKLFSLSSILNRFYLISCLNYFCYFLLTGICCKCSCFN